MFIGCSIHKDMDHGSQPFSDEVTKRYVGVSPATLRFAMLGPPLGHHKSVGDANRYAMRWPDTPNNQTLHI